MNTQSLKFTRTIAAPQEQVYFAFTSGMTERCSLRTALLGQSAHFFVARLAPAQPWRVLRPG